MSNSYILTSVQNQYCDIFSILRFVNSIPSWKCMLDTLMAHRDMQFVNNPKKPDVCDLDKIRSQ